MSSRQPSIHPTVWIAPGAVVLGDVTLEEESSVWYGAILRGDMAAIRVGARTNLQDGTIVHVDEGLPCTVGRQVGVGHRVILHGCTVEDDCLIGMGSILLNGVRIGRGSVVGAGAVLREGMVVPPGSLVIGVPGRIVRQVDDDLKGRIEETWRHYVGQAKRHQAREWAGPAGEKQADLGVPVSGKGAGDSRTGGRGGPSHGQGGSSGA